MRRTTLAAIALLWSLVAPAQEFPSAGLLNGQGVMAAISYSCARTDSENLKCLFVEANVQRKNNPEDLERNIAVNLAALRSGKRVLSAEVCNETDDVLAILAGQKQTPKQFLEMREIGRRSLKEVTSAIAPVCRAPTEENVIAMTRVLHARNSRSCWVAARAFSMSFRYSKDLPDAGNWIGRQEPEGPCELVRHFRFEPIRQSGELRWGLIVQYRIGNPVALQETSAPCKDLRADWVLIEGKNEFSPECDFVEFAHWR